MRPEGGRRREGKEEGVNEGILTVSLGDRSYDIFFANGVFPLFQEWVGRFFRGDAVFVVTDKTVSSIYDKDIQKWLSGIPHHVLSLPAGEGEKHGDTVREIYSCFAGKGAGRDSLVVAFGGGVVGDLAGFAAATFLRGMPYVQIPTTLLSQVDSSVGGKTGYNLPEGKNLVGAFHQPRAVFIDPAFLLTLDDRNLRAGMAEVVKCAFAGVPSLLDSVAARAGSWRKMSGEAWIDIIRSTVAFKAGVVERDEREASTRRILNLGHTVGHALEQASGYRRLLHGEAVAMGLAWEAVFSRRQGVTPPEVERQMIDLLLAMGFTIDDPGIPLPAIASAIGMDKKKRLSNIDMPLVAGPGSCVLRPIPVSLLREDLPAIRDEIRNTLQERERAAVLEKRRVPEKEEVHAPHPGAADTLPSISALERRVVEDPRDAEAMIALAEAYRRAGNLAGAWETIKEALHQHPSSFQAQHVAREIERNMKKALPVAGESPSPLLEDVLILEEGAFELRPADRRGDIREERVAFPGPPAPGSPDTAEGTPPLGGGETVRTVTMASVYWDQGKEEEARRIIEGILRENPLDPRARAWKEAREGKRPRQRGKEEENALTGFLEKVAKEYGYDVPRHY
jgi:3-dehydroquinate synthase